MTQPIEGVQRIVLHGTPWKVAQHLVLGFGTGSKPLYFLRQLVRPEFNYCPFSAGSMPLNFLLQRLRPEPNPWPSVAAAGKRPELQVSLGFSRRGLERACVPPHVLACFALKAPAFWEGAALRAGRHLALSGNNGPSEWLDAYAWIELDAVLSLHAMEKEAVDEAMQAVELLAEEATVSVRRLDRAISLSPPADAPKNKRAQWVHFGFRDGVSRVGIEGWDKREKLDRLKTASRHQAGEFLLGHQQNSGANPWIAGPGPRIWPKKLRDFFRNGSFGVLHQMEQYVKAFEDFVRQCAEETHLDVDLVKAKLCGRYPNGRSPATPENADPEVDFNYSEDTEGYACPFGSHARRMNPRGDPLSHAGRHRPLLRRGMPYSPPTQSAENSKDEVHCGLIGHFFCASIEDQFEHLLGQWADRVPMGSADGGGARDPLIGAHEFGDGPFEIPRPANERPRLLYGLPSFTRTLGSAYLFYPSWVTLQGIARSSLWGAADQEQK